MASVLVVEGDSTIRHTLRGLFLEKHLYSEAGTIEQAVSMLEAGSYDVVVTSISLPGLSGLDLLEHVRRQHLDTPVIVISAVDYQQYSADLIKMGAFDYLVEPFGSEDVDESVTRAIQHHQRLSEGKSGGRL